ncbi:hypothetical protein SASPL_116044 [Salvia splendens]|uniref:Uncharacterized protein n=1 Tax=Salvia splendens TaxID=180675 RepID=A0A8X8Y7Q4_SALSN|nr:hypothetical protein SASPL_116044 [Salvia splendens]
MKISARVLSTKPIPLSRAAKLVSRFAAVENDSSPAVSIYLERTSDAFNRLLQSHSKTDGDSPAKKKRKSGAAENGCSKQIKKELS